MYREQTKVVKIGDRVIGGGNPILIQYDEYEDRRCRGNRSADS